MTNVPSAPATRSTGRLPLANASVLSGVKGVPFWAAIVIALVCSIGGAVFDSLSTGTLGWGLRIGFLVGVTVAALVVARKGVFTAMVQPPLVMIVVAVGASVLLKSGRMVERLFDVVDVFPTMAIGTGLAVVLGLIRILAQPLRRPAPTNRSAHA